VKFNVLCLAWVLEKGVLGVTGMEATSSWDTSTEDGKISNTKLGYTSGA